MVAAEVPICTEMSHFYFSLAGWTFGRNTSLAYSSSLSLNLDSSLFS